MVSYECSVSAVLPPSPVPSPSRSPAWGLRWAAILGATALLLAGSGIYLALEAQQNAEAKVSQAQLKIESAEKELDNLRLAYEEVRISLEKKIQADTEKLRLQLASAEEKVQQLQEQGKVVGRELEVVAKLKSQQEAMRMKLDSVDKLGDEIRQKLRETQDGLEDLRKKAVLATITPAMPNLSLSKRPKTGIQVLAGLADPKRKEFRIPVGMRVYLTQASLSDIIEKQNLSGDVSVLGDDWVKKLQTTSGTAEEGSQLQIAVSRAAVANCVIGSTGFGQMEKVAPAAPYFLIAATPLDGGFIYQKRISIVSGDEMIVLSREDQFKF